MRILFVCKRHPQQRDLMTRPYGRFHYLPTYLAALGHVVRVQLGSYRNLPSEQHERAGVQWSSHDFRTIGVLRVWQAMRSEARDFRPDCVIGCSDTWAGWLAYRLSRTLECALAIDAYDNFESYMPLNLPLHLMWRRAVSAADVVTAAGPQLAARLQHTRPPNLVPVQILQMAADPSFVPMAPQASRTYLNLPLHGPLVGYSGAWTRSRGSTLILDAFAIARRLLPDLQLVLTGKPPSEALRTKGVIALGYLPDDAMPHVLNALNLSCVVVANTAFGRFSYPAKLYESMACRVPVLASATAPVRWILDGDERYLARVGDAKDYADRMVQNLANPRSEYAQQPTWRHLASQLSSILSTSE